MSADGVTGRGTDRGADRDADPMLGRFLLGLAEGMNAAAESVDRIRVDMMQVARAYGRDDIDFVVLPTVILVETGAGEAGRVAIRSVSASFRFDQIAALYRLLGEAKRGAVDPSVGIDRLNAIGRMAPRRGWFVFWDGVLRFALVVVALWLLARFFPGVDDLLREMFHDWRGVTYHVNRAVTWATGA